MSGHVATHRRIASFLCLLACLASPAPADDVATLEQVLDAPRDLWGEAAMKLPNGPSYEFFEPLLPPLRYADTPFRHYPITLSAAGSPVKGRFVSNGSAINALARQPNWIGETGTPVSFRVTRELLPFGGDVAQLDGPRYEQGYLPIVQLRYRAGKQLYAQEAFAPVNPIQAALGVVLVRFTLIEGPADGQGQVEAQIESTPVLRAKDGIVSGTDGKTLVAFDSRWTFRPGRCTLIAHLQPGESAYLAVYTAPAASMFQMDGGFYDAQRQRCVEEWEKLLAAGTQIRVPEKVVNDAWRATTIGNYMLLGGSRMLYSHGNQYAKLYIGEGGDATRAMLAYGRLETSREIIPPLLVYTRKGLEFHQAALKLQMLANYYFLTRDADFVRSMRVISEEGRRPGWQTELDLLMTGREEESGLFPPEKYAGDIADLVYSANSNSSGWRGLRDMAVVLDEIGEKELAQKAAASAEQFRKAVMAALDKSIYRDVQPPFVPLALFGAEKPYERIYGQRLGSYWNIMSKFVLASGVFPPDSEYADALIDYARERGGLCMGMNRTSAEPDSWWINPRGVNDLYTIRYTLTLLLRDEPDAALVGLYGKLAHGMTRDTFIGCEGSGLVTMYGNGRQMYLPPNSAANANFLEPLRHVLLQDYDLDDDGRPETLRLAFATSRRWLEDGKEIAVENAPSAFGDVSFTIRSELAAGTVTADVSLPARVQPKKSYLRLRLPDGWRVDSAKVGDEPVPLDGETLDLTGLRGDVSVTAAVSKK